jgi:hypothetical protein
VEIYANDVLIASTIIPFQPEDFPIGSGIPTGYTCAADTLTVWPPVEGAAVDPIIYTRSSP